MVLVASFLTMLVGTGSIHLVVVALKPIAAEFNWPRAVPSTAFALQYFGGGIGGILMGIWLDRWGMGGPALLGAIMIGLGAMLTAQIDAQWQLYLIYGVMMGLFGRGTLNAPHMANIARWFDRHRSTAVGIVFSGQALGGALWPPVFERYIGLVGWRETAFWYGVSAFIVMLVCAVPLFRRPPEAVEAEKPTGSHAADGIPAFGSLQERLGFDRHRPHNALPSIDRSIVDSLHTHPSIPLRDATQASSALGHHGTINPKSRSHFGDFLSSYYFARRLKTLKNLTPYESISNIWTSQLERFKLDPTHQMPGPNN